MFQILLYSLSFLYDSSWWLKINISPNSCCTSARHRCFLTTDNTLLGFSFFQVCCAEQRRGVNKERLRTTIGPPLFGVGGKAGITSSAMCLIRTELPILPWGGRIRPPWVNTSLFCFLSRKKEAFQFFFSTPSCCVRSQTDPPRPPETQLPVFPIPPHPLLLLLHLQSLHRQVDPCWRLTNPPLPPLRTWDFLHSLLLFQFSERPGLWIRPLTVHS